ncbi:MAG: site-2 protease family protein [Actinomycetota bacterium]|nr:site-2 protease family protein [Actinomycetota bacterium]
MNVWVKLALFSLVALVPSLALREFARAAAAERLGDPTPRRFGRRTLNPRPHFDPFGSGILPGLLLILLAAKVQLPVFAYAKPMPLNPGNLRNPPRDTVLISLAGPLVNLLLAVATSLAFRVVSTGDLGLFLVAALRINVVLFVFNLMPIPGLDGARILARFLSGRAREVYTNMDQYLPLFMLVIFFLLGAPVLTFVNALGNALCRPLADITCL